MKDVDGEDHFTNRNKVLCYEYRNHEDVWVENVTAVDGNGKPTAWEAVDYQPRTHWVEGSNALLFEGDTDKIKKLEQMIAEEMGFESCVPVSGQTHSKPLYKPTSIFPHQELLFLYKI
mgnify:CR=1 FL=1